MIARLSQKAKSILKIHPRICQWRSRIVRHPVCHRESAHRYFHRPFRERNRKDEEEEVKGSRDATSRSRDVYITSPYTHAAAHERGKRGRKRRGTKTFPPFSRKWSLSPRALWGFCRRLGSIYILQARGAETTVVDIRSCYAVCYLSTQLVSRHKKH